MTFANKTRKKIVVHILFGSTKFIEHEFFGCAEENGRILKWCDNFNFNSNINFEKGEAMKISMESVFVLGRIRQKTGDKSNWLYPNKKIKNQIS